ncbi:MAG: hypothetical protein AAF901_08950 [Bacteroidota bacterium]
MLRYCMYAIITCIVLSSCSQDDNYQPVEEEPVQQISPVVFDIDNVPYQTLSEYNFFDGALSNLDPVYGVLPYDMITPLFSDYASKKRFVWMPDGQSASYVNDHSILDFPVGTVLIKNFYYDNVLPNNTVQIIETRLQIKKEAGWVFANYIWNEEQTEATFSLSGGELPIDFIANGVTRSVDYRIPAASQCLTCHKQDNETPFPIGVKPNSLNKIYTYEDGSSNQLDKWIAMGYLENNIPSTINTVADWTDESQSMELRVRSYLDINCAHCHSDNRHCDYRPVRFDFNESSDITNLGVCVDADDIFDSALTQIIQPGNSERSILAFRINSVDQSIRMPLLARTLKHDEGVALIESWINSLELLCE